MKDQDGKEKVRKRVKCVRGQMHGAETGNSHQLVQSSCSYLGHFPASLLDFTRPLAHLLLREKA